MPTQTFKRTPPSIRAEQKFREALAELGAVLLEDEYLGAQALHRIRCPYGHLIRQRPFRLSTKKTGLCRTCAGLDPVVAEKNFRANLAERGLTLLEEYLGSQRAHRARCPEGHIWMVRPDVLRRNGRCPECTGRTPAQAEAAFRARLNELGATLLEPSWLGSGSPHRVRCSQGHDCRPRPSNVRRGEGICLVCSGHDTLAAEKNFRATLSAKGATLVDTQWRGAFARYETLCSQGHTCFPQPNSLVAGVGVCPTCSGRTHDVFYVVADSGGDIKFGITSGSGKQRLRAHRKAGYTEVLRLHTDLPYGAARMTEDSCKATLELAGIEPLHGKEYFGPSALAVVLDVVDGFLRQHRPTQPLH